MTGIGQRWQIATQADHFDLVLIAWIIGVAPSLILEAPESYVAFGLSTRELARPRTLFVLSCGAFTLAPGAPYKPMKFTVRKTARTHVTVPHRTLASSE